MTLGVENFFGNWSVESMEFTRPTQSIMVLHSSKKPIWQPPLKANL